MNGLILAGGESSRMGTPKSHLVYDNEVQYLRVYELLKPLCQQVFVSCAPGNSQNFSLPCIPDANEFIGHGPISGILSAMLFYPEADWLIVACDYPFLKSENLHELLDVDDESKSIIVYRNQQTQHIEPLIGIYRQNAFNLLFNCFKSDKYSISHCITESAETAFILESDNDFLQSVDTPEKYTIAQTRFNAH